MKKSQYLEQTTDLPQKIRRNKIVAGIAITIFVILTLFKSYLVGIMVDYFHTSFSDNISILNILRLAAVMPSILPFGRIATLQSKESHNRMLKKQKNELLGYIDRLKSWSHQDDISQRIFALLRGYHEDLETIAELRAYLKNKSFSYVFEAFQFTIPLYFSSTDTLADFIGDDVERLSKRGLKNYEIDYLREEIKTKIKNGEDKTISLIEIRIRQVIQFIDSLED